MHQTVRRALLHHMKSINIAIKRLIPSNNPLFQNEPLQIFFNELQIAMNLVQTGENGLWNSVLSCLIRAKEI